jgi:hypothetical protein
MQMKKSNGDGHKERRERKTEYIFVFPAFFCGNTGPLNEFPVAAADYRRD